MPDVIETKEASWNDDVRLRRYAAAGLVMFGVFFGGYELRMWADWDSTSLLERCIEHPLQANGHVYCDVTRFVDAGP